MKGLVVKNTGSWYVVRTDDGQLFDCKVKGNFRLRGIRSTNPVAVGDRVSIVQQPTANSQQPTAFITEIEDRKNYIIRKASNLSKQSHIIAANVDQAALIVTISHPETSTTFIDRFLASAEAYRVPVVLIFNKTDIYSEGELRYLQAIITLYESLGYLCLRCSASTGEGIETIRQAFDGKTTLLSGNSGVGKSTLLNQLIPDANVKTAEISVAHDTGLHTTTFSEMYALPPTLNSQLSTLISLIPRVSRVSVPLTWNVQRYHITSGKSFRLDKNVVLVTVPTQMSLVALCARQSRSIVLHKAGTPAIFLC